MRPFEPFRSCNEQGSVSQWAAGDMQRYEVLTPACLQKTGERFKDNK